MSGLLLKALCAGAAASGAERGGWAVSCRVVSVFTGREESIVRRSCCERSRAWWLGCLWQSC